MGYDAAGAGAADLERLLNEHGDCLLRMCTLYLKDSMLAEDAVQDTMVKAMLCWKSYRGECAEGTFLTRIAINVCRDYLRSPWRRRRAELGVLEDKAGEGFPEPADDTLPRAIMALPKRYREAVVLYYYRELTAKEIAPILGVQVSTVTARLSRARRMLKERLKGWYYDEA